MVEPLLRGWHWLPLAGKAGVAVLAVLQLYWVWCFYLYYLRAPVIFYRHSVMVRDATRTVDPRSGEPIDDDLLRFLEQCERALAALGFREPHRSTNLTTYPLAAVRSSMEHPVRGDYALVLGRRPPPDATGRHGASAIVFESEFADGSRVMTSNIDALRYWPDPKNVDHLRLPMLFDVRALYRLHRIRVGRRAERVPQRPIASGKTPEQRLVFTRRRVLEFQKHLVRCRYARRTSGGVRPTVRGAVFGAWRRVFPWRTLDQWWLRRRARDILLLR